MKAIRNLQTRIHINTRPFFENQSYYPEKEHKTSLIQKLELLWTMIRGCGSVERFYYAYGFDCTDVCKQEYISYPAFKKLRDKKSKTSL